ncbi:MAG: hypothetical protein WDN44_09080 [Sphingomonas sp.]
MTIDRLLIFCSLIELSFIACHDGPDCFTCFQWAVIVLLCVKGLLTLTKYRRRAFCAITQDADVAISDFAADTDNPD